LLPAEFQESAVELALSTDGRWLLFRWGDWPETGLYLFDIETGAPPEFLTHGTAPTWQPQITE
jgi:Tol biopolymer transport system component